MEDNRKQAAAKGMLKYLEDNKDLNVGVSELKEQLEKRGKKQVFLSWGLPNRQGMRESKRSSRLSGKERMRCKSPAWRGGIHN